MLHASFASILSHGVFVVIFTIIFIFPSDFSSVHTIPCHHVRTFRHYVIAFHSHFLFHFHSVPLRLFFFHFNTSFLWSIPSENITNSVHTFTKLFTMFRILTQNNKNTHTHTLNSFEKFLKGK